MVSENINTKNGFFQATRQDEEAYDYRKGTVLFFTNEEYWPYCDGDIIRWWPLPEPPEVQESEATSCKFCGSNKSDIRMNSIVCTSCGRKIGNIAPPEVK